MKITNHNSLPAPIYNAIIANPYSRGTANISVTDLIEPPQLVALRDSHLDDMESDASSLVWSLMGQAMHTILERSGIQSGKGKTEQRLYMKVEGWDVSGQFDYIDENNVLWDWKFVSTYEYMNGIKTSREKQLNMYAALARANGYTVEGLRVGFLFRDWSVYAVSKQPGYPRAQAVEVPIPMWPEEVATQFLKDRVRAHQRAQKAHAKGKAVVECTPEERWQTADSYAVYKNNNKSATRVLPTITEAENFVRGANSKTDNKGKISSDRYKIQYRPGASVRCERYCPVLDWCEQGKKYVKTDRREADEVGGDGA